MGQATKAIEKFSRDCETLMKKAEGKPYTDELIADCSKLKAALKTKANKFAKFEKAYHQAKCNENPVTLSETWTADVKFHIDKSDIIIEDIKKKMLPLRTLAKQNDGPTSTSSKPSSSKVGAQILP